MEMVCLSFSVPKTTLRNISQIILELKTVEALLPVHSAQLLTYLKLTGLTLGLLINFNVPVLKQGLKRIVNKFDEAGA